MQQDIHRAAIPRPLGTGRIRNQRDVIRDVMLAAEDCDTWLTLTELRALTRYGEASISAVMRHLRSDGFLLRKQMREGVPTNGGDGRGYRLWEYRLSRAGT